MSQIQMSRYDALLRRVADLKGPGSKVNDALEELFPVIDVERVPGELLFLMGTKVCYGGILVAAEVASSAKIQVFNPAGSGHLATVTKVVVASTAAITLRWDISSIPQVAATNNERVLDTRQGVDELPVCQIRTTLDAATPTETGSGRLVANQPFVLANENGIAILAPGSGFIMATTNQNVVLIVTYYWRERVAEPSELLL